MIVVDSSVWIAKIRGDRGAAVAQLDRVGDPSSIVVGDLVLFEVLQGARDDVHAERLGRQLRMFTSAAMMDEQIAMSAARHSRFLRSQGVTIPKAADLLIATFCIERGYALLHQDRDFDMIARHLDLRIL